MITDMSIKHKTEYIKMEKKFFFDGKRKTLKEKELLLTVIQLLINTSLMRDWWVLIDYAKSTKRTTFIILDGFSSGNLLQNHLPISFGIHIYM